MESTVETLSPTRVRLDIEVPFDELKPSIDKAYKTISKQISIPGFRKGKVPPSLIDKRVGRAAVLEESINNAVPHYLTQAYQEHKLRVLGQPEIDLKELADGEKLAFSAEVDVRPELELPDFSTLEVLVDEIEVSDTDVDDELVKLRDRFSTLKTVERAAANDDFINLDLRATVGGEEIADGSASNISHRVGSGDLLDGLDDAVRGKSAGEEAVFTTTLVGGQYAGETAEVTATIRAVKEKELPELNDEFAQSASEFDAVEELRVGLRERLSRTRAHEQAVQARDRALQALLGAVDIPLPERVVESEVAYRKQQLTGYLEQMGATINTYLQGQGKTEEEFDSTLRSDSEEAVRSQFVLDAVADVEELGVTDAELTQEIVRRAQGARIEPQAYADHLVKSQQLPLVAADLRRGKALSLTLERVNVVDTAGAKVDVDAIRGQIPAGAVSNS